MNVEANDDILCDAIYVTQCAKKLTASQLNLSHGTKKYIKNKEKN